MLDVFTTSTYEEIRRATVDGYVDFDVFDRQLFEDIRDQLTHPDNSDAAHNVMYEAFDLCADAGEHDSSGVEGALRSAQRRVLAARRGGFDALVDRSPARAVR